MNANPSVDQPNETPGTTSTVLRYLLLASFFTLVLAASLFISSGRLDWVMAWAYLGVFLASQCVIGLILIPSNPELVAERTQIERETARGWDRPLTGIVSLFGPVGTLIVAGLDVRFGWSPPIPLVLQLAALAIAVLGTLLTTWAMRRTSSSIALFASKKTGGIRSPPADLIRLRAIRVTRAGSFSRSQHRCSSERCGRSFQRGLLCVLSSSARRLKTGRCRMNSTVTKTMPRECAIACCRASGSRQFAKQRASSRRNK
jgi:hypothetical protein